MDESDVSDFFAAHRAHDPRALVGRWRGVARRAGLAMSVFAELGGYELWVMRSRSAPAGARRAYLSAGVHGDEPAGVWGLLDWADRNARELRQLDLLIFPCLNPWGLENNIRTDQRGRDLNRLFQSRAAPFVEWRRQVGRGAFDIAINLHEDFDARGTYIYELGGSIGESMLEAASGWIAPDPRRKIDDSFARRGVIRRADVTPEDFPLPGLPEAVWLFFNRCPHCLTTETPSEYSLYDRVRAHAAMLSAALCQHG